MADKPDTRKERRNWKKQFLETLRNSANVRVACQAAVISRQSAYEARRKNSKFAAQWDEALEDACDVLEARAWDRSKTSDQLLMFLLRAHRPGKYTEKVKQENEGEVILRVVYGDKNA